MIKECPECKATVTIDAYDDGEVNGVQYTDYKARCDKCDWSEWI